MLPAACCLFAPPTAADRPRFQVARPKRRQQPTDRKRLIEFMTEPFGGVRGN